MKRYIEINKKIVVGVIALILSVCIALSMGVITKAKAAATHTAQEIADSLVFLGVNKSENEGAGKMMFGNVYIPVDCWDVENYVYGAVIFPNDFVVTYGFTGDYINEAEEKGLTLLKVEGDTAHKVTEGWIFRAGIVNMNEGNLDRLFLFAFYVQDKATGIYHYSVEGSASYNGLTNNNSAVDLTQYITLESYNQHVNQLQGTIDGLQDRIEELESGLTEEGVDMTKFVTVAEHNAEIAKLQSRINLLETQLEDAENKPIVEEDNGLTFGQVFGIVCGSILALALIIGVAYLARKKKTKYM